VVGEKDLLPRLCGERGEMLLVDQSKGFGGEARAAEGFLGAVGGAREAGAVGCNLLEGEVKGVDEGLGVGELC